MPSTSAGSADRVAPSGPTRGWRVYVNQVIAAELAAFSRYFARVVQWRPRPDDSGLLLGLVDCADKRRVDDASADALPLDEPGPTLVLMNGNLNHDFDIQRDLLELHARMGRTSRLALVAFNPYLRWLYRLANALGIRRGEMPSTFVTRTDLRNIARISGFEVVRIRPAVYVPFRLLGLGDLVNTLMPAAPLFRWLSLVTVLVLRPVKPEAERPSLTVVIPARNERGNIEGALQRMPDLGGAAIEVIFVEGGSSDGTWEEIQRVLPLYADRFRLAAYKQTGKGKNDAVRLGFSKATCDLLTILDADLTMPPELLPRFYEAYRAGLADFINGSRLVYPMEGEAMRFLNHLGNLFFARALSNVLGATIGDSLCGTKLVSRDDYARFTAWRGDFGDFDPFGDFELIFPAATLGLGIVDVPIRYRQRVYGSTNISRFRNGVELLRMTTVGFFRLKLGRVR